MSRKILGFRLDGRNELSMKIQKKMIRNDRALIYKFIKVDNQFEPQKKCIENDVAAMINNLIQNIFNESALGQPNQTSELNFLSLEDIFYASVYSPHQDNPFYQDQEAHFASPFEDSQNHRLNAHTEQNTETPNESTRPVFKSSYTKNACFNICQKTIKVIKKGVFQEKLEELSDFYSVNVEQFKNQILKKKKEFTGPKALSSYLETNSKEAKVFAAFMKWFLTEKYLRMAINEGEMKDLSKYIEYKNQFILPLLE